jgi:HSP20 family protein
LSRGHRQSAIVSAGSTGSFSHRNILHLVAHLVLARTRDLKIARRRTSSEYQEGVMAKGDIELNKADTIANELERLHQAISQRAYDLFRNSGMAWGNTLTDWLTAERELVSMPVVELRQTDGGFELQAALPGMEAKDLDVQITPEDLLIKAESTHEHTTDKGTVHLCEFASGKIFRSVHFPAKVDPSTAKADCRNGMLHVTVAVAKVVAATAQKVEIKAA